MLSIKDNGKARVLHLEVYTARGMRDCTNGATRTADEIYVSCKEGPFECDIDDPLLFELVPNHGEAALMPHKEHDEGRWLMFGGNYAGTSDARFGKMIAEMTGCLWSRGIAPVFDRTEE